MHSLKKPRLTSTKMSPKVLWRHATENKHYKYFKALRQQIMRELDYDDVDRDEAKACKALRATLSDAQEALGWRTTMHATQSRPSMSARPLRWASRSGADWRVRDEA